MRLSLIYLAILFGVLCMSTSSIIIRYTLAPAMIIAFYRVIFTSLITLGIKGKSVFGDLKEISQKDYLFILSAGVFLALHFGFWITSLSYTSVSSSVLFTNLQVIFVLVFSIVFLKEKLNWLVIVGIMIALSGSMLIGYGDLQFGKLLGDMLALASGLFIAIYYLIARNVRSRVDALSYTGMTSFIAIFVLGIGCLVAGLEFTGYRTLDWLLFFLLALGPGVGGHAVFNWALKYVKAPIVAVSILGESVGASILAFILFQEYLMWYQITGGLLIISGIYMAIVFENKNVEREMLSVRG